MLCKISRVIRNIRPRMPCQMFKMWLSTEKNLQWENERNRLLTQLRLNQPKEVNDMSWLSNMASEEELVEEISRRVESGVVSASDVLYVVNQMEAETNIIKLLSLMEPLVDTLPDAELLQFYQKIIAYRPKVNLKVPTPRKVKNLELLLVCLSQIHAGGLLVGWLQQLIHHQVQESQLPLVAMGYFNIYSKMIVNDRQIHRELLDKIGSIVLTATSTVDYETYLTVLILSLQLQNPLAKNLLEARSLEMEEMTIFQIAELTINLNMYEQKIQPKLMKHINNELIQEIVEQEWSEFMKVSIFVGFWRVAEKNQKNNIFKIFTQKLTAFSAKQHQRFKYADMTTGQVVTVIGCIQSLMINNKNLMYHLLRRLQLQLRKMPKQQLLKLTCCLVTYVRQFEQYFVQLRRVCQERKAEWSKEQLETLNKVFDRCRILFKRPLYLGPNSIEIIQISQIGNEISGRILEDTGQYLCYLPLTIATKQQRVPFVVDTGSPHTYLSQETLNRLTQGQWEQQMNEDMSIEVDVWGLRHQVYMSRANFSRINLLGSDYLKKHMIDLWTRQSDKSFKLIKADL